MRKNIVGEKASTWKGLETSLASPKEHKDEMIIQTLFVSASGSAVIRRPRTAPRKTMARLSGR